jgi:uncharacterized protein
MKSCLVVFALPERHWSWTVVLAEGATVADALAAARAAAGAAPVPWDGEVGIFGEACGRDAVPRDGDRIEIYRPLRSDPKVSRRARAAARKAAPGPERAPRPSSVPKTAR